MEQGALAFTSHMNQHTFQLTSHLWTNTVRVHVAFMEQHAFQLTSHLWTNMHSSSRHIYGPTWFAFTSYLWTNMHSRSRRIYVSRIARARSIHESRCTRVHALFIHGSRCTRVHAPFMAPRAWHDRPASSSKGANSKEASIYDVCVHAWIRSPQHPELSHPKSLPYPYPYR